ncbi:hypothetical protein LCGC14_2432920 [marine sediment metagenome]|uniref:Uncharacterized protein n=1 Tax=marine sediment metagenome TaxID=412755 RepID=A0A0F9C8S9_9ZZZZ
MGKTYERKVEFAVGFIGGQWSEVSITVEETRERVLDDPELIERAEATLDKMFSSSGSASDTPIFFKHVLYIQPAEELHGNDYSITF